jgi:hypothetical protein
LVIGYELSTRFLHGRPPARNVSWAERRERT